MKDKKTFISKRMTAIIFLLLAVLAILIVYLVFLTYRIESPSTTLPVKYPFRAVNKNKAPVQKTLFTATLGDSYQMPSNGKLELKISLAGAANASGSRITGAAINFYDVPEFLSNPKVTVADSQWKTNSSAVVGGKAVLIADGLAHPLSSNQNDFITVTFDAKNAIDSQMKVSIELTDDNIPANGHQVFFGDVVLKKK